MAYKTFTNGFPLPASDLNNYLMRQSVMVFASSGTRASELTDPVEGMLSWLQDTNKFQYYSGTAWEDLVSSTTYTANRAIVSNGSGALAVSTVTSTELGYLSGVTSAVQTQLDSKAAATQTVSDKSANYTIVAADAGSMIRSTGSAITITIANVLSVGQKIDFYQAGSGQITFAAGSGVTLQSKSGNLKTSAQYVGATVQCMASGVYALIGDLGA